MEAKERTLCFGCFRFTPSCRKLPLLAEHHQDTAMSASELKSYDIF